MNAMKSIVVGVLCLSGAGLFGGTTYPVTDAASLTEALGKAGDGDVIECATGDYLLTAELVIAKGVTLRGTDRDTTVLKRSNTKVNYRVLSMGHAKAKVTGFTIRDGSSKDDAGGGGVYIFGDGGTLENCRVTDNSCTPWTSMGGGIRINSAGGLVDRCLITRNSIGNWGATTGCGVHLDAGILQNSFVYANNKSSASSLKGAVYVAGTGIVRNCTVAQNGGDSNGAIYLNGANAQVVNCVSYDNDSPSATATGGANWAVGKTANLANFVNCAFPVAANETTVTDDPSFKDAANGDYTFFVSSALRNAGATVEDMTDKDYAGNARLSGATIDIGCYEFDESQPAVALSVKPKTLFVGGTADFIPTVVGFTGEYTRSWTLTDAAGVETTFGVEGEAARALTAPGIYTVRLDVTQNGETTTFEQADYLYVAPLTNYVNFASTDPLPPYATPDTAATDPLDAVRFANKIDGSEVLVDDGTYPLAQEILLTAGVKLRSKNGPEKTVLTRGINGNMRILNTNHEDAFVSGFTLTGGYGPAGAGAYLGANGGTLEDSIVSNNTAALYVGQGGGVFLASAKSHLRRTSVIGNRLVQTGGGTGEGGGVFMSAGSVENCLVAFNTNFEHCGGIVAAGGVVVNTTVYGNTANRAGGIALTGRAGGATGGTTKVYNCAIFGNEAPGDASAGAPDWWGAAANFINCAVPKKANETSVETSDPAFTNPEAGDFTLKVSSPLRDQGTTDGIDVGTLDLARNPRQSLGSAPDIGCYEYDKSQVSIGLSVSPTKGFADAPYVFTPTIEGLDPDIARVWTLTDAAGEETTLTAAEAETGIALATPGVYSVTLTVMPGEETERSVTRADYLSVFMRTNLVNGTGEDLVAAVDYANGMDGVVVFVEEGTYDLPRALEIAAGTKLVSKDGAEKTVLRRGSGGEMQIIHANHSGAFISGFTITGGYGPSGAGINLGANGATVEDCIISNNEARTYIGQGGGICMSAGTVRRCVIAHNRVTNTGSSASGDGGGVFLSSGRLENCLVWDNSSWDRGGGVSSYGGVATVVNCTVVGNTAKTMGGLSFINRQNGLSDAQAVNTASFANVAPDDVSDGAPNWRGKPEKFVNCAFPKRANETTVVTDDPGFTDVAKGDFHLTADSVLRDAGVDDGQAGDLDLEKNPRRSEDTPPDIGCYEYDKSKVALGIKLAPLSGFVGTTFVFTPVIEGLSSDVPRTWTLTDTLGTATELTAAEAETGVKLTTPGKYLVTLTVRPEGGEPLSFVRGDRLHVAALTNYVNVASTTPREPYATPETAAANVNDVLAWTLDGSVVQVADGVYATGETVTLDGGVTLLSEHGAAKTSLVRGAKEPEFGIVTLNHTNAVLRGFTVTGGARTNGGGVLIAVNGGTVEDCVITNNQSGAWALDGAGVDCVSSKGVVRRCVIAFNRHTGNNAGPAGVRMANGRIENCLIANNNAALGQWGNNRVGGLLLEAPAVACNCTVVSNRSHVTCGGVWFADGSRAVNCAMYGNFLGKSGVTTPNADFRLPETGAAVISNCAASVVVGVDGKVGDPKFRNPVRNDWRLRRASPLVDAGRDVDFTDPATDLLGNPRRVQGVLDIGCYENPCGGMTIYVR